MQHQPSPSREPAPHVLIKNTLLQLAASSTKEPLAGQLLLEIPSYGKFPYLPEEVVTRYCHHH